jgi:hypothetical protein
MGVVCGIFRFGWLCHYVALAKNAEIDEDVR